MSAWASFSATSTDVTAERSAITPPSSSGTPSIAAPSSFDCASTSSGALHAVSASWAIGRSFSAPKSPNASWSIFCSSSGSRSNSLGADGVDWRAGPLSFVAALKVRPAVVAARKPVLEPW